MQSASEPGRMPSFPGYEQVDGDGDIFMADAQPRERSWLDQGIPATTDGSHPRPYGSSQQGLQNLPDAVPFRGRPSTFGTPPAPSTSSDRLNLAFNTFANQLRYLPQPHPGSAGIGYPPMRLLPQSVRSAAPGDSAPPTLPPLSSVIPGSYAGAGFQHAATQSAPFSKDSRRSGAIDPDQGSPSHDTAHPRGVSSGRDPNWFPVPLAYDAFLTARPIAGGPFYLADPVRAPRSQTPPHIHRRRMTRPSTPKVSCTVCLEEFKRDDLLQLACNCRYCTPCLNLSFRAGCANMASFPPKCCGKPLRISVWGTMLEPDILERYKEIEAEFSANRPLYCASPQCSTFIPEGAMVPQDELGLCPKCATATCRKCRRLMDDHAVWDVAERICPKEEEGLTKLYELGSEKKWKQCPTCLNMVEKTDGCNHMDCICGVEFCYRCGNLFDEDDVCECELNTWGPEDDGEEEDEEDDDDEEVDEEDEEDDEDEEEWPNYRLAVDPAGRPRCLHTDLSPMGANQHTCHGCLQRNLLLTCEDCALELCQTCVDKIRNPANGDGDDGKEEFMDLDHRGIERGPRPGGVGAWSNNADHLN